MAGGEHPPPVGARVSRQRLAARRAGLARRLSVLLVVLGLCEVEMPVSRGAMSGRAQPEAAIPVAWRVFALSIGIGTVSDEQVAAHLEHRFGLQGSDARRFVELARAYLDRLRSIDETSRRSALGLLPREQGTAAGSIEPGFVTLPPGKITVRDALEGTGLIAASENRGKPSVVNISIVDTIDGMSRDPASLTPLSPAVFHILVSLSDGDRHGYAIIQDVAARTHGKVRLGPGTLYRSIQRMLDDELILEAEHRPDRVLDDERRRYYRITAFGRRVVEEEAERLARLVQMARASGVRPRKA